MNIVRYTIALHDPLYYAREGLDGAFTPPCIHATALNCAVSDALCETPDQQPFVQIGADEGKDAPRYKDSRISRRFYLTPAAPELFGYWTEMAKGENDGFVSFVRAGEILKATQLNFIPPETQFTGFAIIEEDLALPRMIRLGSFRGIAELKTEPCEQPTRSDKPQLVSHYVDPLVSRIQRGVMMNLFPYPIVGNAVCHNVVGVRHSYTKRRYRIAWPDDYPFLESQKLRNQGVSIV